MPPDAAARGRVHAVLGHPRVAMAAKGAVAATLAWVVAEQLPGPVAEYSFYAPFGAVATMYPAVAQSAAESVRATAAIGLGAVLGLATDRVLGSGTLGLALVVAVGILLAGIRWVGEQRVYVPVAAVFVMLLGQGAEVEFSASYAGLFLLGAAFSVVANALFPSFPLRRADDALRTLRRATAEHLRASADRLERDDDPPPAPRPRPLGGRVDAARTAVGELVGSSRGNRRAHRDVAAVDVRRRTFAALERAVLLVDDLDALAADRPWGASVQSVPTALRSPMAEALRRLAEAVETVGLEDTEPGVRADVDGAVSALAAALAEHEDAHGRDAAGLLVATVVTTLRRTLSVLTPEDRIRLPGLGASAGVDAGAGVDGLGRADTTDDDGPDPRRDPGRS
ncbi:FUSC family protein [Cellulomonas carbonis]|uniref:FUSC family protein n=1 Tax=Cellulomonas carbonis T26 TaxID=947969 RepID=A0A0A0BSA0_9CELL|nr:hypothetical protein [Cellulomonas carbonis]KGM11313.1 hypothetical protein N868_11065 [Cellulomonas carbonis T26]GGC01003.1 hypothetical protein GCM10010972_12230 [Cellulomonas carbonis]